MNAVIRDYFTFKGRITRAVYWLYYIIPYTLLGYALEYAVSLLSDQIAYLVINVAILLIILFAMASGTVKRFHDLNRTGWWSMFFALPLALSVAIGAGYEIEGDNYLVLGALIAIMLVCLWLGILLYFFKGTKGPNKYGDDPLG